MRNLFHVDFRINLQACRGYRAYYSLVYKSCFPTLSGPVQVPAMVKTDIQVVQSDVDL
jgi:hypothetical protein